MKRYAKPTTEIPVAKGPEIQAPLVSDISIQRLIDDMLLVLYREVKNIQILSVKGKLDANTARDLRDHLKLLFELKDRENESLKGMTDEDLQKLLDHKGT
jgi:hypothetical protein